MSARDLLPDERHFFEVLLSRPFEGRDELREQALHVLVSGPSCICGCPSVALEVDHTSATATVADRVPDGVGLDADGNRVGVTLLMDREGYLKEIDVSPIGENIQGRPTETYGRPTVESFELADWEPHDDGLGGTLKNVPGRHREPGN